MSILQLLKENPPPDPLPPGWILRKSGSQPGTFYYYNQETGEAQWEEPKVLLVEQQDIQDVVETTTTTTTTTTQEEQQQQLEQEETIPPESVKRSTPHTVVVVEPESTITVSSSKRPKLSSSSSTKSSSSTTTTSPKEVRVLHILKKHKDSRRPFSWRSSSTITLTREDAREELKEILSILKESQTTEELRATMEEVARTESDCSSAKRGGDLGYFGKKKMQPEFEKASFALQVGELSELVETSSGIHIILRVG